MPNCHTETCRSAMRASAFVQAVKGACVCRINLQELWRASQIDAICMPMQVSVRTALAVQMLNKGHGTVA